MSEHDDTLLDEDLGDEEYDLGNDEEEALLADDYELNRQNSYKGEEETDDVLDLGVTDALDDLEENDEENIAFSKDKTDNHNESDFYNDGINEDDKSAYYEQNEVRKFQNEQNQQYEEDANVPHAFGKGDLREKLQKKNYVGNGQGLEDDDGEEARERRNRFQSERVMISPKMNNEIPDSLENVVTCESSRIPLFRGRGRGRGIRGARGGRFITQNTGNYNVRFGGPRVPLFENQQAQFRPPLLENRPPFLLSGPNNGQNQQIVFQQPNPHMPPYQQFPPNGPGLPGPRHFVENRPPFNPNQFQGPIGPPGPRPINPRMEYGSRGPIQGGPLMGPPYNGPHQPQYPQMQPGPFQSAGGLLPDNQGRPGPMQGGAPGPLLHGSPGGSLLGAQQIPSNAVPMHPGGQMHPMQGFPPRQQAPLQAPVMPSHQNPPMPAQPPFDSRPPFQEPIFEGRPYEQRPPYVDQVPNNQFSNNALSAPQPPPSNVPNVPLPPGHKILINPHFRGAVQPAAEARLAWDMAQHQTTSQPQVGNNQFLQTSASYQNQGSYNQGQQGSTDYQQSSYQQNKSDDPYSYFSDVWQENKPQKNQSSPNKPYLSESNYSRESSYDTSSKYKSDGPWDRSNYQEDHKGHKNYRERDLPPRSRSDHVSKTCSSTAYRNDSYDQRHSQRPSPRSIPSNNRTMTKPPPKRLPSEHRENSQQETSPKRAKTGSRNLQEIKRVDTLSSTAGEKKEEESDPEMLEYKRKMEEQKRLREKILREKEDRRKKAALEKQSEETKVDSDSAVDDVQQESKPVAVHTGVAKDAVVNKSRPNIGRGRGRPPNAQATETVDRPPGGRIIRAIPLSHSNDSSNSGNMDESNMGNAMNQVNDGTQMKSSVGPTSTRRVVIQKPLSAQKVPTTIHRVVSNIQKGQMNVHAKATVQGSLAKIVQNPQGSLKRSVVPGQRVAPKPQSGLQKTLINVQTVASANAQKVIVNTQNNQRVVLQKSSVQAKKALEVKTNTVKLENLAASTSEAQIRRMCQGIGTIESIHMGEGTATIVFKTQSAAMVFHKKYQRKMLDLSLITVRLLPQTAGNKATAIT